MAYIPIERVHPFAIPVYSIYIVIAAALAGLALVAAAFYKSRIPSDPDAIDCEQAAKLFDPSRLGPMMLDQTSQHIQPSLKSRVANTIHWKSASQQVIDTLRPEAVSEYRGGGKGPKETQKERQKKGGRLNFSVGYDPENSTLHVNVLEAIDLPIKDFTGSSDPYVRVFLLQSAQHWERTKVHRRNLNPKFNQTLSFPGHSPLSSCTVNNMVYRPYGRSLVLSQ